MEEPRQLLGGWFTGVAAVAESLVFAQETDGHWIGPLTVNGGFAKVITFAPWAETDVLLEILVCRSILQKPNVLQELLRQERGEVVKIGYARVSTQEQNLDLQMHALKKAGCRKIFREKVSGASRQRPEFQRMLEQLRAGDTIIVWRLDRLARSTRDLLETMAAIGEGGAHFQSLSEPWANTTTHAGKLIMTVFAGIAEFERDLIRERTKAGRNAARDRGVSFGRPRKLNPEQAKLARQLISEGKPVRQIAQTFNVHAATIYRLSEVAA